MFKRVIWTGVGYGLGVGSSVLVQRKVKRTVTKTVERYTPAQLREQAAAKGRAVVDKAKVATIELRAVAKDASLFAGERQAG
ncbi:MAG: hypothetical protein HKN26_03420 [Acidimicrobiales bacterium]|nr:hypothetical protein [Acidimicrobiales bacterium]